MGGNAVYRRKRKIKIQLMVRYYLDNLRGIRVQATGGFNEIRSIPSKGTYLDYFFRMIFS